MSHEMIQRMWRNKGPWLNSVVQLIPAREIGVDNAIIESVSDQTRRQRDITTRIMIYEEQGCVANSLDEIILP